VHVYNAPSSGYYGVVAVNDNGADGVYDVRVDEGTVAVDERDAGPTALEAVSPNPAHGGARFAFMLAEPGEVDMDVVDMAGRRIVRLAGRHFEPGRHELPWDGR